MPSLISLPPKVLTRIVRKGECWIWYGGKYDNGYGRCWLDGKGHKAHRLVYALLVGDPGEFVLHHKCENILCCNPDHLELMTNSDHLKQHHEERRHAGPVQAE